MEYHVLSSMAVIAEYEVRRSHLASWGDMPCLPFWGNTTWKNQISLISCPPFSFRETEAHINPHFALFFVWREIHVSWCLFVFPTLPLPSPRNLSVRRYSSRGGTEREEDKHIPYQRANIPSPLWAGYDRQVGKLPTQLVAWILKVWATLAIASSSGPTYVMLNSVGLSSSVLVPLQKVEDAERCF